MCVLALTHPPTHQAPATTPVQDMVNYCHDAHRRCHSNMSATPLWDVFDIAVHATEHWGCLLHPKGKHVYPNQVCTSDQRSFDDNDGHLKDVGSSMWSGWSIQGQAKLLSPLFATAAPSSFSCLSIPDTHIGAFNVPLPTAADWPDADSSSETL